MKKLIITIIVTLFMFQNIAYAQEAETQKKEEEEESNPYSSPYIIFPALFMFGMIIYRAGNGFNDNDNDNTEQKKIEPYIYIDNNKTEYGIKFNF